LPAIAPALRESYGLSVGQIGVVLAAEWAGALLTFVPWGLAADRLGERWVLTTGLGACGLILAAIATVEEFWPLVLLLALAGAFGASVSAASGRAVMHWFGPEERGLALGVRQTAIPAGGLVAALVLPQLSVDSAFLFLGGFCLAGALAGGVVIRECVRDGIEPETVPWTLRDRRLWVLCLGSGMYVVGQVALIGFVVLYLHDERGLSKGAAAAVLAAVQIGAVALRIGAGRWSDLLRKRVVPLRLIGLVTCTAMAVVTALLSAPLALLLPSIVVAGSFSMAWNGLSFTAAAELAGHRRSGAAIGVQQSAISAAGVAASPLFALAVASTSWRAAYAVAAAFPLVGWLAFRPLRDR
jgi:sugar phosphate permease